MRVAGSQLTAFVGGEFLRDLHVNVVCESLGGKATAARPGVELQGVSIRLLHGDSNHVSGGRGLARLSRGSRDRGPYSLYDDR